MAIYGLWVINKAGGLVYQKNFPAAAKPDGLAVLTSNEYLVLAGTLHGIHAITARLSPTGSSSGAEVIEGETFKMTIKLTPTGKSLDLSSPLLTGLRVYTLGTKFVLLTSLIETSAELMLGKVYEAYADSVMKNPFQAPEMPIRSEGFDTKINSLFGVA
ncbi:hypothetical protein FRC01_003204 [Tulasnella sp. 417]|nr:hypothetical protein FRC01_003204 [Tulasnella sp. 417]